MFGKLLYCLSLWTKIKQKTIRNFIIKAFSLDHNLHVIEIPRFFMSKPADKDNKNNLCFIWLDDRKQTWSCWSLFTVCTWQREIKWDIKLSLFVMNINEREKSLHDLYKAIPLIRTGRKFWCEIWDCSKTKIWFYHLTGNDVHFS
jgi:hypothetical protein